MATLTFDVALFRAQFPEFANGSTYPDALLQGYWDMAACFVSDEDYGFLSGSCRQLALNMLVAHFARINDQIATGNDPSIISSATVDKVSISRMTPKELNQWNYWLNQTPYGQQLLALLKVKGAGGLLVGGINERAAFRQIGGFYLN